MLLLLLVTLIFCYAAKCQTQCTLHSTCPHPAGPCQHTSIIMLWMLWEKVDLPRPPSLLATAPTRNSELSCCCCCSRNAVEVCGHILARMFLYQTRLVATRRRDQTQRDQTRPDQTVVRVLGLLEQEELASFTSCLLSFAALSLLAICFEFGINFSHRTQEIEMFP